MPRHVIHSSLHLLRFIAISPILFGGCHDIYTQFCTPSSAKISCLSATNAQSKTVLQSHFNDIYDPECPFELQVTHYNIKTCNNPTVKSVGSDFDGYVRINVFKADECYWRTQKDFKAEPIERIEKELLNVMRSDLID